MELTRVWAVIRKLNGPLRLSERFLRFTVAVLIKNLNFKGPAQLLLYNHGSQQQIENKQSNKGLISLISSFVL